MSDFTTLKCQINTGTNDATTTWTDAVFGTANVELRMNKSGGGATTSTASASWPSILKPVTGVTLLDQLYVFTADTTGFLCNTYDGTGSHYNQGRINWDALGSFGSAPILSAWATSALPAASPGTQPGTGDGTSIINGTSGESSSRSLLKATVYGVGVTSSGTADTPSANMGSNPSATTGTTGAVTTAAGAWCAWQDLQAASDWIALGQTPKATTAGNLNFLLAEYLAASMTGGTLVPVIGWQYTWI